MLIDGVMIGLGSTLTLATGLLVALSLGISAAPMAFLITMVTQSIIPEANREGEPSLAGILYIGGLSLYALMSLTIK